MNKIGIIGDTGIVGSELEIILSCHPWVEVTYKKNSHRVEGNLDDVDLVFLATKADLSMVEAPHLLGQEKKVIDMSGAYRLPREQFEEWYGTLHISSELISDAVYGMPALNGDQIFGAELIANPGCYATSIILALYPLVKSGLVLPECTVVATSGISGAGETPWKSSDEVAYSYGRNHQHVPEVEVNLGLEYGFNFVSFTPIVLKSVYSGLTACISTELNGSFENSNSSTEAELKDCMASFYLGDETIEIYTFSEAPDLGTGSVNRTPNLKVKIGVDGRSVTLVSILDNLGKGAASQAVENMNLMLGYQRLTGVY